MIRIGTLLGICSLFAVLPVFSGAQELRPLTIEDALNTRALGEMSPLALAPDGRWFAYMVQDTRRLATRKETESVVYLRSGVSTRNREGEIWATDTFTGQTRSLTNGHGSSWDPVWSPDGRYLAFLCDQGEREQARVWIWSVSSDEVRPVADLAVRSRGLFDNIKWLPDSKRLLVPVVPQELSVDAYVEKVLSSAKSEDRAAARPSGSTVTVFEANSVRNPAGGTTRAAPVNLDLEYLHDLAMIDIRTGRSKTVVHGRRIRWFYPSPDGTAIAYVEPKPSEKWVVSNLVTVDLATFKEQVVASDVRMNSFSWSPDSSRIGYGAYSTDGLRYDYYVVGVEADVPRKVSSLPEGSPNCCQIGSPAWDLKGGSFYFIFGGALWRTYVSESRSTEIARVPGRTIRFRAWGADELLWTPDGGKSTLVVAHDDAGKEDGFYRIDLETGSSAPWLEKGQCYTCKWAVDVNSYVMAISTGNQKIAYVTEDAQHAPDVWLVDSGMREPRKITALNPQFDGYVFGTARLIDWLNDDGERVRGALLLPAGYEDARRYPLIVWSYPNSSLSEHFSHFGFGMYPGPFNAQLFATRGYAVLLADTARSANGPVAGLTKSVLPGVNRAIDLGIADPDRIGLMGHSNGGFAVLALVTETPRFKAAVAASGYGDFEGLYGAMREDGASVGYSTVESLLGGGGPWQNPQRFFENSPQFHLDRIQTPLLLIHGTRDDQISSFLSDAVFGELRLLGKEVEYLRYEGESHAPRDWSCRNQADVASRVIAWFDKHLRPEPQFEKGP